MFDYNLGIINYLFLYFGIPRMNWFGQPLMAFFSIVLADVWKTAPFVAVIVLAGLSAIPQEMYKASVIDGANSWQRFRYITLPLLLPVLGVAILFRAIDALRIFDLVYVLTGGGPGAQPKHYLYMPTNSFFIRGILARALPHR